jgi:hypothetical protein
MAAGAPRQQLLQRPMKTLLIGLKNLLLWSYGRGTWQYDILCLLIVGAVFLLPNSFFGDRDRPLQAKHGQANVALKVTAKEADSTAYVEFEKLSAFWQSRGQPELLANHPNEAIVLYFRDHLQREIVLKDVRAQYDARGQLIGYRIWFE